MARSKGYRRKTRHLLSRKGKKKGLTCFLRKYNVKDRVDIDIYPSQVKGMPHRRFQGLVGIVEEVRRRSLVISVPVGDKNKKVVTRLEHVRPHTGN